MNCWQVQQLRLVSSAADTDETFQTILAEVNRLGFQYCSFGMKAPVPLIAPRVLWCSNYPEAWKTRYEQGDFLRRDPTVAHAIVSDEPILWSDALFATCPELRLEARAHGLAHGWAQPRRDSRGMVSLLTCARTDPPICEEELQAKAERLQWLSYLCHEAMLKHWDSSLRDKGDLDLSAREREVLRWSCDGKTSADMAQIIGVSEATVNFHMRNACQKLGTGNKTAAAVMAALMGLLS
ncbi:autoinducer binding domain-containing protein [Roseateles amylovorans]|uniref:Autoinducer binding domain-containing protein n=1 Tax=Roseateles amylovorans TaxID=2978473 RepID=A0ABY6B2E8_9BURK|nr:autoinducer binding domain-containing protein [Roseateles amylovorans]UXH77465.1 autoinducer binding domain-containing protein [Roseateles amylovorans]